MNDGRSIRHIHQEPTIAYDPWTKSMVSPGHHHRAFLAAARVVRWAVGVGGLVWSLYCLYLAVKS